MKYEIIKGSEKDFDGAPDWAMVRDRSNVAEYFSSGLDKGCKFIEVGDSSGEVYEFTGKYPNTKIIAERRPITEPVVNQQLTTEWDGTGIAHLGQHVEYFWAEGKEWRKGEVVAHYEGWPLLKDTEDGLMVAEINSKMRPIRSPEDVARSNIIGLMERAYEELTGKPAREAEEYYDFIAAGKIPGIAKTPTVSELMNVTEKATREDCEAIVKLLSGK